ncbi:MAG: GntR family transcriptional regulator [Pseudobutyrivibrio sp.]|nr:GntR family transcriptional regulator [Pseudobutyrivibrio sp.]
MDTDNTNVKTYTSDMLYDELYNQIIHLELRPGDSLSEIETGKKYNLSRTPVRDVFKRLASDGLVEIIPQKGTFISKIDLKGITTVLYLRDAIEKQILQEPALYESPEAEFTIQLVLDAQLSVINDSSLTLEEKAIRFFDLDLKFHESIYQLAGRIDVYNHSARSSARYERYRNFMNMQGEANLMGLYQQHKSIWDSIASKRVESAQKLNHDHIYETFVASAAAVNQHPEFFVHPFEEI